MGDSYSVALYSSYRRDQPCSRTQRRGIGTLSFDSRRWLATSDFAKGSGPAYFVSSTPYGQDRMQVGLGVKLRTGPLTCGLE